MGQFTLHLRGGARIAAAGVLGATALAACGVGGSDTTGGESDDSLTAVFLSGVAYDPCAVEYAEKFEEETGVAVEVLHEGYPTFHDKLLTTLSSGAATYDVIMSAYQWTGEFAPFLVPLTEQIEGDDSLAGVIESASESYVFDGEQYAVPFSAQAESLFYRTDLFQQAGLEPPTTWDDFEEIADFFTDNPDYPGVYGTSIKGSDANSQSMFSNRYYGLGGEVLGEPGSTLDVDLATQALELLRTAESEYSPAGSLQATFTEVSAQFTAGTVAMAELMPTTVLGQITPETPDNKVFGNVGVTTIPGGTGEMGGWGLAVPESSENQERAFEFAAFMASEEADHACFVEYGKSPVQSASYEADDVAGLFYADGIRASLENSLPRPSGATAGKINTMITDVISRFTAGQIATAAEAAQEMADQYDQLVNE